MTSSRKEAPSAIRGREGSFLLFTIQTYDLPDKNNVVVGGYKRDEGKPLTIEGEE